VVSDLKEDPLDFFQKFISFKSSLNTVEKKKSKLLIYQLENLESIMKICFKFFFCLN